MPLSQEQEQERVYKWLNNDLKLPVFAEAYKGAVILIDQKHPGYISFVAHAGRDLMNSLAPIVEGITAGRVQYQQHLDKLQDDWRDEWQANDGFSEEARVDGYLIPIDVCRKISTLVNEHKSGRMRSSAADGLFFSTFLDYSDIEKIPGNFLLEWKKAREWFMKHTHLREKPFRPSIEDDLVKNFKCLDGYLYIAASSQYNRLRALNEILDATNQ